MTTKCVLLVMGDLDWTMKAVHQACTAARRENRELVILKMQAVQYIGWLGMPQALNILTTPERHMLQEVVDTVNDYGITATFEYFQYVDLPEAIDQAADAFQAAVVFATLPPYIFAWWRAFQLKRIIQQLHKRQCRLYTLDRSATDAEWIPSVAVAS